MFERFTERARHAVILAQDEARTTLRHNYVGTEHLLLGLLREQESLAARVLGFARYHHRARPGPRSSESSPPSINRETGLEYLRCSFCGKTQTQVERLIAGPGRVYICSECVELCAEVLAEEREQVKRNDPAEPGAT